MVGLGFAGTLLMIALWDRRSTRGRWVVLAPLAVYWVAGASHHKDPTWMVSTVSTAVSDKLQLLTDRILVEPGLIESLPRMIGVVHHRPLRARCLLVATGIWKRNRVLLSLILPRSSWSDAHRVQIWSMRDYTMSVAIPLMMFIDSKEAPWLRSNALLVTILLLCLASQYAWVAYLVVL